MKFMYATMTVTTVTTHMFATVATPTNATFLTSSNMTITITSKPCAIHAARGYLLHVYEQSLRDHECNNYRYIFWLQLYPHTQAKTRRL